MATQEYEDRSGWLTFAAVLMFAVALVRIVSAIRYFDDGQEITNLTSGLFGDSLWAWGVWDLCIALLALFAGWSLLTGGAEPGRVLDEHEPLKDHHDTPDVGDRAAEAAAREQRPAREECEQGDAEIPDSPGPEAVAEEPGADVGDLLAVVEVADRRDDPDERDGEHQHRCEREPA